ncbi:hypothetical protein [Alloacidobacterium sp.]|uniref:hypothetical protein n=1 Tax=Alloacidobacterium sp. TaxID=2951999 RepID=UPI002D2A4E59|nr:hypothetical protein [Alloacidobacterium sp.]HYK36419.1 hypothetical protein [Alloacidobacterium sp.]
MGLTLTAQVLWAAGFLEHAALLFVLLVRRRWRIFPVFTALIGFNTFRTILLALLLVIYKSPSSDQYAFAYWGASFVDLALQIGIIYELARVVLKPTGTWVLDAKRQFLIYGIIGAVIAAAIAYGINPSSPTTRDFWIEKGELFSAMLTLELFAAMLFASSRLGLVGSSHVMRLGQGWATWAIVALLAEGIYSHFGPDWHNDLPDTVRILVYQAVTIYWIVTLWRPEPKHRTLSADMQAYLDSLHVQLQSELKHVGSIGKQ